MKKRARTVAAPASKADANQLFALWKKADQCVPFPYLYQIAAVAPPGQAAKTLRELSVVRFVYRLTNEFSARLAFNDGQFGIAEIHRENLSFRLMAIQGSAGLMSAEAALETLEHHVARLGPEIWADLTPGKPAPAEAERVTAFRRLAWQSLHLDQRFAAGVVEPHYRFRKAATRVEFRVGARSGTVRHQAVQE